MTGAGAFAYCSSSGDVCGVSGVELSEDEVDVELEDEDELELELDELTSEEDSPSDACSSGAHPESIITAATAAARIFFFIKTPLSTKKVPVHT